MLERGPRTITGIRRTSQSLSLAISTATIIQAENPIQPGVEHVSVRAFGHHHIEGAVGELLDLFLSERHHRDIRVSYRATNRIP